MASGRGIWDSAVGGLAVMMVGCAFPEIFQHLTGVWTFQVKKSLQAIKPPTHPQKQPIHPKSVPPTLLSFSFASM
jgi:hypothetical protein